MTIDELRQLDPEKVTFVDIREKDELSLSPSPEGAVHIPMTEMVDAVNNGKLPKDKQVVTICRSGARCGVISEYLTSHGYQADHIDGGVIALKK